MFVILPCDHVKKLPSFIVRWGREHARFFAYIRNVVFVAALFFVVVPCDHEKMFPMEECAFFACDHVKMFPSFVEGTQWWAFLLI